MSRPSTIAPSLRRPWLRCVRTLTHWAATLLVRAPDQTQRGARPVHCPPVAEGESTATGLAPAFYDALADAVGELDRFERVEPQSVLAAVPELEPVEAAAPNFPEALLRPIADGMARVCRDIGGVLGRVRDSLTGG